MLSKDRLGERATLSIPLSFMKENFGQKSLHSQPHTPDEHTSVNPILFGSDLDSNLRNEFSKPTFARGIMWSKCITVCK